MAATMTVSAVTAGSAVFASKPRSSFAGARVPRAATVAKPAARATFAVRAGDDEPINPLAVQSSRTGLGYQEKDSAGQSNIFSVEPPVYVAGSSRDDGQGKGSALFAGVGGLVAVSLIAGGLKFVTGLDDSVPTFAEEGNYESLSYYKAKFTAPAPAPVAEAPEL